MAYTVTDLLRLPQGPVSLADLDSSAKPGLDGAKREAQKALRSIGPELAELQEKMYAEAYTGGKRRILVVLQGMDTSGKGGVIDHALGLLSPNGFRLTSFKKPTEEELAHDFLWRIDQALPDAGMVGVFDRSHYEDVLIGRVHELADEQEIERRYTAINEWEKNLVDDGTVVIKCMLHVSDEVQRERLLARLEDPEKHWKFHPTDVDEREHWGDYAEGLRDRAGAVQHRRRALVRRTQRPQVVPQLGRRPPAARGAAGDAAGVARARLRRRRAARAARGRGRGRRGLEAGPCHPLRDAAA